MKSWSIRALVALILLPLIPLAPAQEKSVRPGINKPFENPDVKEYVGKFEVESREVFSHRKEIVATCDLKPGMTVADVGAGPGLFTLLFAREVGERGKVYAVDIAPKFIEAYREDVQDATSRTWSACLHRRPVKLPPKSVDHLHLRHLPSPRVPVQDACLHPRGAAARRSNYLDRLPPDSRDEFGVGAEPRPWRAGGLHEGDRNIRLQEGCREKSPQGELLPGLRQD